MAKEHASAILGRTTVRLLVGDQDPLLPFTERYSHWLTSLNIEHQLAVAPGADHTYKEIIERRRALVLSLGVFLSREEAIRKALGDAPQQKRPMDNIEISYRSPGEDEGALAVACFLSPEMSWSFPRREEYYDRYLTFRGVPQAEVETWKRTFMTFLKKLTWRYNRVLLLKSPTHTARVKMLLDMFPGARFIHVHRNPFAVYRSTRRLYDTTVRDSYLQRPPKDLESGILRRYTLMYDAFFQERTLIPPGHYHEVCFE